MTNDGPNNPRPALRYDWKDQDREQRFEMIWVPGTDGEPYQFGPRIRRSIELAGFYISRTPVTQAFWTHLMGDNPAIHQFPSNPVENVSWAQIVEPNGFLGRLNQSGILREVRNDAKLHFRLPSETEWEYAARGGPDWRDGFDFSGSNRIDDVGWYGHRWSSADQKLVTLFGWRVGWQLANRARKLKPQKTRPHPVGEKMPNQLGLFDMSGNVWEWCQDICTDDLDLIPKDGSPYIGPGSARRLRGGCHHNWDLHCRVWWRYGIDSRAHDDCIGFRLVLSAIPD